MGTSRFDEHIYTFATEHGKIYVESFQNGVATLYLLCGMTMDTLAIVVEGCFEDSCFEEELQYAFKSKDSLVAIDFKFNDVDMHVTKEDSNHEQILETYHEGFKAVCERQRKEWEEYTKTPEYQKKHAEEMAEQRRINALRDEAKKIDETTEMEFSDDGESNWKQAVAANTDGYGRAIIKFAQRWAKYMQYLMKKDGKTVAEVAQEASTISDIEGMSGFSFGCAVSTLVSCWKYGEDLRKWHNGEWGYEGDGVVNPAILTVKVPD